MVCRWFGGRVSATLEGTPDSGIPQSHKGVAAPVTRLIARVTDPAPASGNPNRPTPPEVSMWTTWILLGALTAGLFGFIAWECRPLNSSDRQRNSSWTPASGPRSGRTTPPTPP